MKIEEYLQSLPQKIISGDDVQLPTHAFLDIFKFVKLSENDVFYHLGCGNGAGVFIAKEEFNVKKSVGIDLDKEKITVAKKTLVEKKLQNCHFINEDVLDSKFDDATVVLF
ncbi:MAG: class I SAM-dependent methyltransferase, partial [Thermoproteota archaeon]